MNAVHIVLIVAAVMLGGYQAAEAIIIADIPTQHVNAGSTLRVDVQALEVSGTPSYGLAGATDDYQGLVDAAIDTATGHLVFVPARSDAGNNITITVAVRDLVNGLQVGELASQDFDVVVGNPIVQPGGSISTFPGVASVTYVFRAGTATMDTELARVERDGAATRAGSWKTGDLITGNVRVPTGQGVVVFRATGTSWTIDQNYYLEIRNDTFTTIANPFTDPSQRLQLGTVQESHLVYAGETLSYTLPVVQPGIGGITWSVQEGQRGDAAADGGTFTWTPNATDISTTPHTFGILAATESYSQTRSFSVLVVDPQRRTEISAHDDPAGLAPGQNSIVIDVLANDILVPRDGDINVTVTDPPSGSATVNADNTITYTPDDPGAHTTDSFEYTVSVFNMIDTETDTASVTVGRPQDMLAALADSVTVPQGLPVDIDVLANDGIEPPDTTAAVQVTVHPQKGNATANDDGTIRYTPGPLQTGPDTLEYNVTVDGLPTQTAAVSIQIDPYGVPPAPDVLVLPAHYDDSPEFVLIFQNAGSYAYNITHANATALTGDGADGMLTWPPPDGSGSISLQIPATAGLESGSDYMLVITAGNTTLASRAFSVTDQTVVATPRVDVATNAQNKSVRPDGVIFTLTFTDDQEYRVRVTNQTHDEPAPGTRDIPVSGTGLGSTVTGVILGLEPETGYAIGATPTGTVPNGTTYAKTAFETAAGPVPDVRTVADENLRAPAAKDVSFDVQVGGHITVDLYLDGRITDADQPDGTLAVNITGTPRAGTALVSGTQLVYTATGHPGAIDRFEYTVTDADNATATANVTATLTGQERLIAVPDGQITMRQGIPIDIDVLANDIIEPADTDITVNVTVLPQKGNATANDDGTIRYTPGPFDSGPVVFEYGISSPGMPGSTAAVMLTVNSSAPPPKPAPDVLILPVRVDTSPEFVLVFQNAGSYAYRVLHNNSTALTGSGTSGTLTWPPTDGSDSVSVEIPEGAGLQNGQTYKLEILSGTRSMEEREFEIDTTDPTVTPEVSLTYRNARISALPEGVIFTLTFSDYEQYAVRVTRPGVDTPESGTQEIMINGTGPGGTATGVILGLASGEVHYDLKAARADTDFVRANYVRVFFETQDEAAPPVETVTPGSVPELPPVAGDFEIMVEPGVPAARDLALAGHVYDVNQQDQTLTVGISRQPAKGMATSQNTTVTYTAGASASGSDIFEYVVTDDGGLNATGTVTAHLPTNDPPVAGNATMPADEGSSTPLDLAPHITDPDGDIITVSITSGPQHGNTTVSGTTVTYYSYPGRGATADSFTYRATDPAGAADSATVNVTITPNGMPVAHDLVRVVQAGQNVTVDLASAGLASDPDGDPLTVSVPADPAHGRVTTDGAVITYAARSDSDGISETLGYRVSDGRGASAEADFTVYIGTPPPDAIPETDAVNDQRRLRIPGNINVDILANDIYRTEGQPPVVVAVRMPGSGQAVPHDNGTVTYGPDDGFTGEDHFEYSIYDPVTGANDTATVTIEVLQNMRPQVTNTSIGVAPGASADVDLSGYVSDDIQEIQDLVIAISAEPVNGNASLVNGTIIRYEARNMTGTDRIEYTVTDDGGLNATAMIAITISALVAVDDFDFVMQGSNVTIPVLDNDIYRMTDPPVRLVISMLPVNGYINMSDSDRAITYTPNPEHSGPDRFEYTLFDDIAGTNDMATVHISIISSPNAVPSASNYDIDARPGQTVMTDPVDEGYATDLDGTDTLRIGIARDPLMGNATVDGTVISYTAYDNASGTDEFVYSVTDGSGTSDSGTIMVTILRVAGNPPVLTHIPNATIQAGNTLEFEVTANDTDGESFTFGLESEPDGAVINATTGHFSWTPNASQTGDHPITVTVSDAQNLTDSQNFTVTVTEADTGSNQNPVAPDVQNNARLNALTRITPDITDPDGDNVRITGVTGQMLGTVDQASLASGTILYRPNQTGIDKLTYEVEDGRGGADSGTINIYINERSNARPALAGIGDTGTTVGTNVNFTANAADANGDPLTFEIANAPEGASINGTTGYFSWTPAESQNGTHIVTIIVHDDQGGASWQDVTITVLRAGETNRPPVPEDITTTAVIGEPKTFQPRIMDPDGDTVTMTLGSPASRGTILDAFVSRGILIYIGTGLGSEEFTYALSDGRGGVATGTIRLEVLPPANISPTLGLIGDRNINALQELAFDADATDIDSTMLTFGLIGEPAGAQITPQGAFSWTPTEAQEGSHNFTVIVSDDAGGNDTETITVNVRDKDFINSPPIAPDIVDSLEEATPGIIRPPISDPNDDPVRITATTGNTKGEIITGFLRAGIVIYRPNADQTGIDTVNYTVSDGSTQTSTGTITVFINADGNRNPVLAPIGFRNINAGEQLTFDIMARDRDPLSYLLAGAPAGAEISEQGAFSWTPASTDVGNHTFTIAVYDERGGSSSEVVTMRVLPAGTANGNPTAPPVTITVNAGSSTPITPEIGDPDGDQVSITGATGDGSGTIIPSPDSILYIAGTTPGSETVTYTVEDVRGATSTGTIMITIQ